MYIAWPGIAHRDEQEIDPLIQEPNNLAHHHQILPCLQYMGNDNFKLLKFAPSPGSYELAQII